MNTPVDELNAVVTPETETPAVEGEPQAEGTAAIETAQPKAEGATPKDVIPEKQYKDNQRTINKLEREINRLKDQAAVSPALLDKLELLEKKLEYVAENMGTQAPAEEDMFTPTVKRPSYREHAAKLEAEIKARQTQAAQLTESQAKTAADIGQMITDAGLAPDDPRLDGIRQAWQEKDYAGAKSTARAIVSILKASKPAQAVTTSPTAPSRAQTLKDEGLLKVDTGGPTGSGSLSNPSDRRRAFAEGRVNAATYQKWREDGLV